MTVAMIMSVIMARIVLVSVSVIVRIALRLGLNGPVGHAPEATQHNGARRIRSSHGSGNGNFCRL